MISESRANSAEAILNKLVLEIAGRAPEGGSVRLAQAGDVD